MIYWLIHLISPSFFILPFLRKEAVMSCSFWWNWRNFVIWWHETFWYHFIFNSLNFIDWPVLLTKEQFSLPLHLLILLFVQFFVLSWCLLSFYGQLELFNSFLLNILLRGLNLWWFSLKTQITSSWWSCRWLRFFCCLFLLLMPFLYLLWTLVCVWVQHSFTESLRWFHFTDVSKSLYLVYFLFCT